MREIPQIDTTSTADISFILLIFFLLASSFNSYKGLEKNMPSANKEQTDKTQVKKRNALQVEIAADNTITLNGMATPVAQIQSDVERFIENKDDNPDLPERFVRQIEGLGRCKSTYLHTIMITTDRQAEYNTYFQLQNALQNAYHSVREKAARQHFRLSYDELTARQQQIIRQIYPHNVVEQSVQDDAH